MLTHGVIHNWAEHFFDFIRVKGARRPSTPDKEQVRVGRPQAPGRHAEVVGPVT